MPAYPKNPTLELKGKLSAVPADTPAGAVASQLLTYFTSGDLEAGARLPPERQLAQMLGTGRSAVREALAALEILGIVHVRPGSGTYLKASASELLPQTLSWGLMLGEQRVQDLLQIRTALEVLAAESAASVIEPENLAALQAHLVQMEAHQGDYRAFVEADMRFHQEMAAISGNETLGSILQSVRALLRIWVDRSISDQKEARDAIAEHREVLSALITRDPAAVRQAMESHMETANERLLSKGGRKL
ncbi:FadR/GntR family transcriptional regulator [Nesterenkonia halotolerans]|uniref:GntR family transcriptional repressor for pyruvate dehydrogenase complex n=1 Tax=Nesterenkonia halotolerans TaxID=225325 RepID=A0ABR9J7P3_9MICC|nr:FadR/GntR family transcriptional regulator [Nesterenkonia halotolerans]MBE1514887.1 GntR family transcriptional repressor for pyruvate dehydrogenase complex [Nesterenkonia halotolerans]